MNHSECKDIHPLNVVVVTGATSMIGCSLIRSLLLHEVKKIYAVIQPNSQKTNRLPADERIKIIPCLCEKYEEIPNMIVEKCDVFFHFAWIPSKNTGKDRYYDVESAYLNIGQSLKALKVASIIGCYSFIGAGSQAEYGNRRRMIQSPDDSTDPITTYAIAKDCVRRLCMEKAEALGINCQWVRIFSVYGPHDRDNTMISTVLPKLLRGDEVLLTDCQQQWEYLYEDDAGEGLYYASLASGSNIFCLGSGESKPLYEFVEEMKCITKSVSIIRYGSVLHASGAVMNMHSDICKLKKETGWPGPQISFRQGINSIIDHICNNKHENNPFVS